MRLLIHDYAGHPFQFQLSKELANRGHATCHAFCASLKTTPQAGFDTRISNLTVEGIDLGQPIEKFSYLRRWRQERHYGHLAADLIHAFSPEVVVSANTPLDAQRTIAATCRRNETRFIVWLQDVISVATDRVLRSKVPFLGGLIGSHYLRLEKSILRNSDFVIPITDDFTPLLSSWGVSESRIEAIENWAVIEETPVRPRRNDWSKAHGLDNCFCFLYSGTLGLKHNPGLLLSLAEAFQEEERVRVVVVSQGLGADWLREHIRLKSLKNLIVLEFQPYHVLPDVLSTADVLLAILEPDAGTFSVPSKVLTNLCAQRPLLLAVPEENLAARIVRRADAGIVVSPEDTAAWLAGARQLYEDEVRDQYGANARRYAKENFDIKLIADRFEEVLKSVAR